MDRALACVLFCSDCETTRSRTGEGALDDNSGEESDINSQVPLLFPGPDDIQSADSDSSDEERPSKSRQAWKEFSARLQREETSNHGC